MTGGYLKVLSYEREELLKYGEEARYELTLTDYEVKRMFHGMVRGWFKSVDADYNDFVKSMLQGRYVITSNRESGFGRYDVMLCPRDTAKDDAILMEFKARGAVDEQTLMDTAQSALSQIEKKQYAAQLIAHGIAKERIHSYGFAFEGKKVLIVSKEKDPNPG